MQARRRLGSACPAGPRSPGKARSSFTDAFGFGALVVVVAALLGAILVLRFMPPHHLPQAEAAAAPGHAPLSSAAEPALE